MSKTEVQHYEDRQSSTESLEHKLDGAHAAGLEHHIPFSAAEDKKLMRKVDLRTIPWLAVLYLLAFLDRANVGNAKIEGLLPALHMTDAQYALGLTLFFVSYAVFEVPSNMLLKKLTPRIWLSTLTVLFGINATLLGVSFNHQSFIAARWFLGIFEAGLFPGVNYYLSTWYKRNEFGLRSALFFSAATASGAFGGLLAAGISKMSGAAGVGGWAWIFILEGIVTVVAGVMSFWIIVDFPSDAKFLSERERAQVLWRLAQDQQMSAARHEKFSIRRVLSGFWDVKTILCMIIYAGALCPLYAFSLFIPTIIKSLGYTNIQAQLHTVPVYIVACFCTIVVGFLADRWGNRTYFVLLFSGIGIVGYAILRAQHTNPNLSYAGTFLGAMGIYPLIPLIISLASQNVEPSIRRGVALGCVIGFGNLNGVVSSNIYPSIQAKRGFPLGHTTVLAYLCVCFLTTILLRIYLQYENAQRAAGKRDHILEGKTEQEIADLGDWHPRFVYKY